MLSPARALFALLAVAAVLSGDAALARLAREVSFPQPAAAFLMGIGFAQIALGSAWLVGGRNHLVLKTLLLVALLEFWSHTIAKVTSQPAGPWLTILLMLAVMLIPAVAFCGRLAPWKVLPLCIGNRASPDGPVRCQFRLYSLMSWMTACCLLSAMVRRGWLPWSDWTSAVFFCLALVLVALIALWAARKLRLLLSATIVLGSVFVLGSLLAAAGIPPHPPVAIVLLLAVEGLAIVFVAAAYDSCEDSLAQSERAGALEPS